MGVSALSYKQSSINSSIHQSIDKSINQRTNQSNTLSNHTNQNYSFKWVDKNKRKKHYGIELKMFFQTKEFEKINLSEEIKDHGHALLQGMTFEVQILDLEQNPSVIIGNFKVQHQTTTEKAEKFESTCTILLNTATRSTKSSIKYCFTTITTKHRPDNNIILR